MRTTLTGLAAVIAAAALVFGIGAGVAEAATTPATTSTAAAATVSPDCTTSGEGPNCTIIAAPLDSGEGPNH